MNELKINEKANEINKQIDKARELNWPTTDTRQWKANKGQFA